MKDLADEESSDARRLNPYLLRPMSSGFGAWTESCHAPLRSTGPASFSCDYPSILSFPTAGPAVGQIRDMPAPLSGKPTPNPSQKGIFLLRGSFIKVPSWEGQGWVSTKSALIFVVKIKFSRSRTVVSCLSHTGSPKSAGRNSRFELILSLLSTESGSDFK